MIKSYFYSLFVFFLILLAFFPLGLYFFSFIILGVIAYSNIQYRNMLFYVFFVFLILSICINETSVQRFLYVEDDFTTYYDNYLSLLNGQYSSLLQFGGGFEVGFPLLNLIISKIIRGPYPYILQIVYILTFIILMIKLSKYIVGLNNTLDRKIMLLWGILFLKVTAMLTIERQAMASLFILCSFFDLRKRFFWFIVACFFHISTPIVYICVRLLLNVKKFSTVFKYVIIALALTFSSYQILTLIIHIFPNDKVGYVLYHINNNDLIINEFIKSIKQVIYVIPLILLASIYSFYGYKWHLFPSLILFITLMLVMSILPGVPTRIFMPIIYCLFGYYYYDFLSFFNKRYQVSLFSLIVIVFFLQKLFTIGYYYRYPLINTQPFYYISEIIEPINSVSRSNLKRFDNIKVTNENKL